MHAARSWQGSGAMIQITVPEYEVILPFEEHPQVPSKPGIYCLCGVEGEILYVGQAHNLAEKIMRHATGRTLLFDVIHNFHIIKCFVCDNPLERELYETFMVQTLRPPLNRERTFLYESGTYDRKYYTPEYLQQLDKHKAKKKDRS